MAPKWWEISQPSKGTRQMGMTREESEKNRPTRMLGSGRASGQKGDPVHPHDRN